jgi:hypothetical protein
MVGNDPVNWLDVPGQFRYYGNWGRPNWTGGVRKPYNELTDEEKDNLKDPIDAQDACYKDHDIC